MVRGLDVGRALWKVHIGLRPPGHEGRHAWAYVGKPDQLDVILQIAVVVQPVEHIRDGVGGLVHQVPAELTLGVLPQPLGVLGPVVGIAGGGVNLRGAQDKIVPQRGVSAGLFGLFQHHHPLPGKLRIAHGGHQSGAPATDHDRVARYGAQIMRLWFG